MTSTLQPPYATGLARAIDSPAEAAGLVHNLAGNRARPIQAALAAEGR